MKNVLKLNNVIEQELTKSEIYSIKGGNDTGCSGSCWEGEDDLSSGGDTAHNLAQNKPPIRL